MHSGYKAMHLGTHLLEAKRTVSDAEYFFVFVHDVSTIHCV